MPRPKASDKKPSCFEEVLKTINESESLTSETKCIFKVLIDFMKTLVNDRDNKVNDLENKLEQEKLENETKISNLETELDQFKKANKDLETQICKMKDSHDELEANGRRESLIFSGNKIKPYEINENCVLIAKNLIKNDLKMQIDPLISTAHRMGRPPAPDSSAPDKRPIIVKFCRRDDAFLVMKTASNKNTRVSGLFCNESLTRTRSKILYALRQAKKMKNSPITGTSTLNGRVFAHHKASTTGPAGGQIQKTEINTMDRLTDFCTNFIKKPLETFLNN